MRKEACQIYPELPSPAFKLHSRSFSAPGDLVSADTAAHLSSLSNGIFTFPFKVAQASGLTWLLSSLSCPPSLPAPGWSSPLFLTPTARVHPAVSSQGLPRAHGLPGTPETLMSLLCSRTDPVATPPPARSTLAYIFIMPEVSSSYQAAHVPALLFVAAAERQPCPGRTGLFSRGRVGGCASAQPPPGGRQVCSGGTGELLG